MRGIILLAMLFSSTAWGAAWVELGKTPEARILLDKESVETFDGKAKAWLKFLYRKEQPAQTLSRGKPFDSSINQYYVICSTSKYQVLQLTVFDKNEAVGAFQQPLNLDDLDDAKPGTGVMFLLKKVCPAGGTRAAPAAH